ncbi:CheR family methyltransferase [Azospirillum canadense]|uniref:CheR family methyltransferase n=1 Tax=Azospirillum canadense TaxID=403962 RepID=UPI00222749CC|nr:CheR family methyltransferase [Azospirillum canadense]MCW2239155.1 two-component system CheB/CheR fusion protein [Azospirillum canadense]
MTDKPSFPIVGIGASAGGVEALEGLFRAMPADSGMAFVVVTHLAPEHESLLADIIGRCTKTPARQACDGEAVEPNRIYTLQPGTLLTIGDGALHVRPLNATYRERNPVDIFLGSLADDCGERAIGIILSGGGSDGTLGVKAIKERGGFTIAQGHDGIPRHAGMPNSAIAAGVVDLVVPVEAMAATLVDIVRVAAPLGDLTKDRDARESARLEAARKSITTVLRKQVGHDFRGYKPNTFLRRVQRRMQALRLTDIDGYVQHLREDHGEAAALFRDLLIGVTTFFRDGETFQALEDQVIPHLFAGKDASDAVRVWVPGCATGEEAYSVAMLLSEYAETLHALPRIQVFATDIDDSALEVARTGRYPASLVQDVPPGRLKRHFIEDGTSYVVRKEVRDLCIFSAHSIVRDPPFSRIDLISCRNLLIYLGAELQDQVIPMFHYALRPGGYLFLGVAETIGQHQTLFAPIDKKHRLFRRQDTAPVSIPFPLGGHGSRSVQGAVETPRSTQSNAALLRGQVEARVLERFAPAHVVVNQNGEVVYYSANTGKYLQAPPGVPNRQLLAMARKGLRLDLRGAMHDATQTHKPVTRKHLAVEVDDRVQLIDLTIEPFDRDGEALFLIVFSDVGRPGSPEAIYGKERHWGQDHTAVEQLERELRDTKERLQSTIEEYETSLEELKSANEELISVNEELQSTNEELETAKEETQSVNEELHAVNLELNSKVEALDQSNSDLQNLFNSTRIGIVFLDRNLLIRSFTSAVTEIFNLIASDRGRPLTDIVSHLDRLDLARDLRDALVRPEPLEKAVQSREGHRHYIMRILPYRNARNDLEGLLLTFVDVTSLKEAEEQQRQLVGELDHRVKNMLTVITALARQTLKTMAKEPEYAAFLGRLQAISNTYDLLTRDGWGDVPLRAIVLNEVKPYTGEEGRFTIEGPVVQLRPKAALALGMVIHELATNAVKYGSLSVPAGHVAVTWEIGRAEIRQEKDMALLVRWRETNGPEVTAPAHHGFGSRLITQQIRHELRGDAVVEYDSAGLEATLMVPITQTRSDAKGPEGLGEGA